MIVFKVNAYQRQKMEEFYDYITDNDITDPDEEHFLFDKYIIEFDGYDMLLPKTAGGAGVLPTSESDLKKMEDTMKSFNFKLRVRLHINRNSKGFKVVWHGFGLARPSAKETIKVSASFHLKDLNDDEMVEKCLKAGEFDEIFTWHSEDVAPDREKELTLDEKLDEVARWVRFMLAFERYTKYNLGARGIDYREIAKPYERQDKLANPKPNKKAKVKKPVSYTTINFDDLIVYDKPKKIISAFKKNHVVRCELWPVRGHWRHYKSGKTVFVESFHKSKKRNDKNAIEELEKEYRIKMEE